MDEFPPIRGFENYGVRIDGVVINLDTGRRLFHHVGRNGHVYVSLSKHDQVFQRLLGRIVGDIYLPKPPDFFDTIIHHDYDFTNNHASNLSWRPRHFAVKYHRQRSARRRVVNPVMCVETGEVFPSVAEAAISYGVLEEDILTKLNSGSYVFPIGKSFDIY